jgi:hypothetical protein
MTSESSNQAHKVGVLIYRGVDVLDFAGPIEVLSNVTHNRSLEDSDRMFDIKIIACSSKSELQAR